VAEDEDWRKQPEDSYTDQDDETGSFLSPDDVQDMLSSLEDADRRLLGEPEARQTDGASHEEANLDNGCFVSPQELDREGLEDETGKPAAETAPETAERGSSQPPEPTPRRQAVPYTEALQADLLARIAGEVRSIKMELTGIKQKYDEERARKPDVEGTAAAGTMAGPEPVPVGLRASEEPQGPESRPTPENRPEGGKYIQQGTLDEIKRLLNYLDGLLESLPEEKIDEFARSEYFELYRKIFEFFGLV